MNETGRLIIIAAPSGGGKTSVINYLLGKYPEMVHSISCTTRPARPGELNGKYYHHIDRGVFEGGIQAGRFAEWARVHGEIYGTPKEPLDKWLKEGRTVVLDLDVVGSLNLKKLYGHQAVTIFLLPPSTDELKKRLLARATDSAEVQSLRLNNALEEITHKDEFDHTVVNGLLEKTCLEVERIITST